LSTRAAPFPPASYQALSDERKDHANWSCWKCCFYRCHNILIPESHGGRDSMSPGICEETCTANPRLARLMSVFVIEKDFTSIYVIPLKIFNDRI
jgi:hypothetical protein